jgi:hypothetical protein
MTRVTIDPALLARLNGLAEQSEFRDESGQLLGHFVPARKGPVKLLSSDGCPYSPEELERMRNEAGGRPLVEIWKSVGAK